MISRGQNWFDGTAICASGLCLLHCVIMPVAIALLPLAAAAAETTEMVHVLALIFVVPVSLYALGISGSRRLLLIGCLAIALLVLGAAFEDTAYAGTGLTMAGSCLLIYCHYRNWQRRRAAGAQ